MKTAHAIMVAVILFVFAGCSTSEKVLFTFDAANAQVGLYRKADLDRDWKHPRWENGVSQGLVSIIESNDPGHPRALSVFYPKGSYSDSAVPGKVQWIVDLSAGYKEIYFAYDIKFDKTFDFVKGGKLHGLAGGTRNSGGRKPSGVDGFSCRVVWLPEGRLGQYVYHPDQPSKYGQVFKYEANGQDIIFERDRWYRITNRVVMNRPKEHDGLVQAWVDGRLVLDVRNIRFRDIDSINIDSFYFTTFFGGDDKTWAAVKDEHIYFDNFIIATQAITGVHACPPAGRVAPSTGSVR